MLQIVFIGHNEEAKAMIQTFVNTAFPHTRVGSETASMYYMRWYQRFFTDKNATLRHAVVAQHAETLVLDVDRLNANTYRRLKWWDKHKEGIDLIARLVPELVWNRIPDHLSIKPCTPERVCTTAELPPTCRFFESSVDVRGSHAQPNCEDHHGWAIDSGEGKLYQRLSDHEWRVYPGL